MNGARVLVADNDEPSRALYLALLTQVDGVRDVLDAADGSDAWVAAEAERLRRALPDGALSARDRSCTSCGYGIACAVAPSRCPMCGQTARWTPAVNARVRAER